MRYVFFLLFLVACSAGHMPSEVVTDDVTDKLDAMEAAVAVDDMEMGHSIMDSVIAGSVSKYQNWDKSKFDEAVADGKLVYLEFSANWCSSCKAQEEHLKAAFELLDDPGIVGFKVHYKDDETTDEQEGLAKKYQVPYQMTKVILKNGEVVMKSPEPWEAQRIIEELTKLNG